jgi:FK506-binding nuclear protein
MPIAVALWSTVVKPGQALSVIPQGDLVITNAALGAELADPSGRTSVKLTYMRPVKVTDDDEDDEEKDDEDVQVETVLCSLTPGKIEQCTLNLTFEEDDEFLLEVVGKNEVHLSGNYIDQAPDQIPYNDESELETESDHALDEVSSDVEMNPEDLADILGDEDEDEDEDDDAKRFEEVPSDHEAKTLKSTKRRRVSDTVEHEPVPGDKTSKKAKKLKAENGAAVPVSADAGVDAQNKREKKDKKAKKGVESKEGDSKKEEGKGGDVEQKKGDKGAMRELPNGLKIQDAKLGDGPQAKSGMKVNMRYIGKLLDGKVFDSNKSGKPFSFRLGAGEVIKGWDEGVAGMKVGGERLLIVPPPLGYGKRKMGDIPPNSTLRFEVKLLDIK